MIEPKPQASPYDSCHHKDTSLGDTFGGLGVCDEVREEDARASKLAKSASFSDHGPRSASANPHTHETFWPRSIYEDWLELIRHNQALAAHESAHDKP